MTAPKAGGHTPGPWFVFPQHPDRFSVGAYRHGSLCIKVADAGPREIITGAGDDSIREDEAAANAARIVACVNACEGMDDPARDIGDLVAARLIVERQRDELAAALGWRHQYDTDAAFREAEERKAYDATAGNVTALEAWQERVRAALAKVRP